MRQAVAALRRGRWQAASCRALPQHTADRWWLVDMNLRGDCEKGRRQRCVLCSQPGWTPRRCHELDHAPGVPVCLPDPSLEGERPRRRSRFFILSRDGAHNQLSSDIMWHLDEAKEAPRGHAGHLSRRRPRAAASQRASAAPPFKPALPSASGHYIWPATPIDMAH